MADPSGKSPSGAQEAPRRYYALFLPQGELLEFYRRGDVKAIIAFFQQEFAKAGFRHLAGTSFDVSLPAPRWRFVGDLPGKGDAAAGAAAADVGKVAPGEFDLSRLLLAYEFDDPRWGPEFLAFLDKWLVGAEKPIVGVDLRFDLAEHWCPSEATSPIFGTRRDAGRLIGIEHLADSGCTGERVNVVIVDQGLDAALTPNFGGGWISGAVALPADPGLEDPGDLPLAFGPGGPVLDDGIAAVTTRTGVVYATEDVPGSIRRTHELGHPRPYFPRRRGHR